MNFRRGKKSIPPSVPQSAPREQLPSGAGGRRPEVVEQRLLVGLHLGPSYSSFDFARSNPPEIFDCANWPGEPFHRDATPTAIYYKPEVGTANGDLCFRSWGYTARKELEEDLAAVRDKLQLMGMYCPPAICLSWDPMLRR
ncbi:unnamed protein product [Sphagnum troendelagicum]|uniref:Uncharacterized protein n=1 Tax=Sphagnum troendelagicum TaxID=128251 RepID=A0ABP0TIA3_9BRYO